jgi:peptidylprolyl isomerase
MRTSAVSPRWVWLPALSVVVCALLAVEIGVRAAATSQAGQAEAKKWTKTASGLLYFDEKEGEGASPKSGQTCVVDYTGWLWENGAKGKKFDSSKDRRQPFPFRVGVGEVIKGWDEGVSTMKPGGKRDLLIPPELGYGARGAGGVIPPNATLFFEVELKEVK